MAGWLAPPARCAHVAVRLVLGADGKMFAHPGRRDGQAGRPARRGRRRGAAVVDERRTPSLDAGDARRRSRAPSASARSSTPTCPATGSATTCSTGTGCSRSTATPAPYLQYAHARIRSIFRRAGDAADASRRVVPSARRARGARPRTGAAGLRACHPRVDRAPRSAPALQRAVRPGARRSRRSTTPAPCCAAMCARAPRQPPRTLRRHGAHARHRPRPARYRNSRTDVSGMVVHLIDGTYELFRHFYGRAARQGKDRRSAPRRRPAHRARDARAAARRTSASPPTTSSSRSATDCGPATRPATASSRPCGSQFQPLEEALAAMGVVVWPMVEFEADDALAAAARLAAADDRGRPGAASGRPTRTSRSASSATASCRSTGARHRSATRTACARSSASPRCTSPTCSPSSATAPTATPASPASARSAPRG